MGVTGNDEFEELLSAYDVGHLTAEKRAELSTLLDEYDISHQYVGSELQAAAAEAELIEDLIEYVDLPLDDRPPPPSPLGRLEIEPESRLAAALAPRWRRFVAFLVEGYLLAGLAFGAGLVVPVPGSRVVAIALGAVSGLVLVATTGRTVGMWLFNMRVVVPPEVIPPGWGTAAVRFLVVNGPGFVLLALGPIVSTAVVRWLGLADTIWLLACFGPILFDPWRRGLHDRAARTMVVYADSVGPLE